MSNPKPRGRKPGFKVKDPARRLLDCWIGCESELKTRTTLKHELKDSRSERTVDRWISSLARSGTLEQMGRGRYRPSKYDLPATAALLRAVESRVLSQQTVPLNIDTWVNLGNFPPLASLDATELGRLEEAKRKLTEFMNLMESVRRGFWAREVQRRLSKSDDEFTRQFERLLQEMNKLARWSADQGRSEEQMESEARDVDSLADRFVNSVQGRLMPRDLTVYVSEPFVATTTHLCPALEIDTSDWMLGAFRTGANQYSMLYHYLRRAVELGAEMARQAYEKQGWKQDRIERELSKLELDDVHVQSRVQKLAKDALLNLTDTSLRQWRDRLKELNAIAKSRKNGEATVSSEDMLAALSVLGPKARKEAAQYMDRRRWFRMAMKPIEQINRAVFASEHQTAQRSLDDESLTRDLLFSKATQHAQDCIASLRKQRRVIENADRSELLKLSTQYPAPLQSLLDQWGMSCKAIEESIRAEARESYHG
jgi:hypothetical protein